MTTILIKKKDTTGAPSSGDLTNATGGAEIAVNTFDKRLYTKDSGGTVVELGTNPTDITTGTVDTTNIEVTNIKAKDGTAAVVLTDSTGAVAVSTPLTANGGVVFNEAGADVDFRVEGDTNANLLFVDAGNDRVGICTNAPQDRLTINEPDTVGTDRLVFRVTTASGGALYFRANDLSLVAPTWAIGTGNAEPLAFNVGGTERMRIDSSGNVGIGTTSPDTLLHLSDASGGAVIRLERDDTIISTADVYGSIEFEGQDTSSSSSGVRGSITGISEGTGGNMALVFSTAPFTGTNTERARITSDGYLRMASGSGGIQFGGDTAAANALDDYEEGTWTPVIADATTGGNTSATAALSATYTKIGRLVTVQCYFLNISTAGMTSGNSLYIRGLPFTALNAPGSTSYIGNTILQITTFSGFVAAAVPDNTSHVQFLEIISGSTAPLLTVSDFTSGSADIFITITYEAA